MTRPSDVSSDKACLRIANAAHLPVLVRVRSCRLQENLSVLERVCGRFVQQQSVRVFSDPADDSLSCVRSAQLF